MKKGKAGPRRNPAASALRTPAFRPRVKASKKGYTRKGRHARPSPAPPSP